jgi:UDP-2,3-diacylglucosamine hydrolase
MTPSAAPLALFVSDLHLQAAHGRTAQAFLDFLAQRAPGAGALYLLGDLFEYWAGDDDLADPFNHSIAAALRQLSESSVAVYWIAGNRDFLVGSEFAEAAGVQLLSEPHVAHIGGQRLVLLHGDAECTDDVNYMVFRSQVRDPAWQAQFLAMPLSQRKAIIAGLRDSSRHQQGAKSYQIMDVTEAAIAKVYADTGSDIMIHGHTHRPALHVSAAGLRRRYVLPDWDMDTEPQRGGWIEVNADGAIVRRNFDGAELI